MSEIIGAQRSPHLGTGSLLTTTSCSAVAHRALVPMLTLASTIPQKDQEAANAFMHILQMANREEI
jgi:hypothetical protein